MLIVYSEKMEGMASDILASTGNNIDNHPSLNGYEKENDDLDPFDTMIRDIKNQSQIEALNNQIGSQNYLDVHENLDQNQKLTHTPISPINYEEHTENIQYSFNDDATSNFVAFDENI